jgi:hypothetical protein
LLVQALLLGGAVLLLTLAVLGNWLRPDTGIDYVIAPARLEMDQLIRVLAITSLIHLLMVWGEVSLTHPTAHARLAIHEMTRGRFRNDFWFGTLLSLFGGLLPFLALVGLISTTIGAAGAPLALVGLMLFESAYVQSGQSVPLA